MHIIKLSFSKINFYIIRFLIALFHNLLELKQKLSKIGKLTKSVKRGVRCAGYT